MIRVLVADDQTLVRTGFRMIVDAETDMHVVGEARDGAEALAASASERPDLVLMDIRMPNMDGIEATARLTAAPGGPHVLILTTFDLDDYVYASLRAGASGFLLKDTPPDDLVNAIRVVARGDALLAPSVTRRLIAEFASTATSTERSTAELDGLTDRETEVLRHLARGLSNAELATELFVSETTVKTHVGRILTKLGVRDRVQAVIAAYETGLVRPGDDPA